ncbi:MAG: hypothetical protein FWD66_04810 [Paludibacter sp.]|nr:hypothetical protein [Paludibacter sp.]
MKNIKKIYFAAVTIVFFAAVAFSCKPEGNDPQEELVLSNSSVQLTASTFDEIQIVSGNGGYGATSSEPNVATPTVESNNIRIDALAAGTAEIKVTDSRQKTATISVTVEALPENGFLFNFLDENEHPIAQNGNVNSYSNDDNMLSLIKIQKNCKGNVEATLKITLLSGSTTTIGYCGWGLTACTEVTLTNSVQSSKIVLDNNIIDPNVESMTQIDASTIIRAKYELMYGDKTQTVNWTVN